MKKYIRQLEKDKFSKVMGTAIPNLNSTGRKQETEGTEKKGSKGSGNYLDCSLTAQD